MSQELQVELQKLREHLREDMKMELQDARLRADQTSRDRREHRSRTAAPTLPLSLKNPWLKRHQRSFAVMECLDDDGLEVTTTLSDRATMRAKSLRWSGSTESMDY